jgi:ribosomal protein S18 acetylase RimI-like enzyme
MRSYTIKVPQESHWPAIADMVAEAIPNAIVSSLSTAFGSLYYCNISQKQHSCSFVALDDSGKVVGVIIGTLDRNSVNKLPIKMKVKLLLLANLKLFSLTVLMWVIKGLVGKITSKDAPVTSTDAELLVIAVSTEYRRRKIAYELVEKMESFFKEKNLKMSYLIHTEKANVRANRFYSKIGAVLINTHLHHGREINEWHKSLA